MTQTVTCTPELVLTPQHINDRWEIGTAYERSDGNEVNLVVTRPDEDSQPELLIGVLNMLAWNPAPLTAEQLATAEWVVDTSTYEEQIREMFHEHVQLSIAEARLLRDLLNRPEVQAILDAQPQ